MQGQGIARQGRGQRRGQGRDRGWLALACSLAAAALLWAGSSAAEPAPPTGPLIETPPQDGAGQPTLPQTGSEAQPAAEASGPKMVRPPAAGGSEITPHRVGLPKPGQKKRILVQIDPAEQARALAALAPIPQPMPPAGGQGSGAPPDAPLRPGAYDWYWQQVSPRLGDRQGRFETAIGALALGPDGRSVNAPRLATLQQIAQLHGRDILMATIGTQVSPALVLAVIGVESGGRKAAVSSAGAVGLMQLIPATASRFGVGDSTDAAQNIKGGVAYLDWLMREFDNDPLMVLAAYNAGENAVKNNNGVPPYTETRDYVPKVLAAWSVARSLCLSPPELVSDGCVFRTAG